MEQTSPWYRLRQKVRCFFRGHIRTTMCRHMGNCYVGCARCGKVLRERTTMLDSGKIGNYIRGLEERQSELLELAREMLATLSLEQNQEQLIRKLTESSTAVPLWQRIYAKIKEEAGQ